MAKILVIDDEVDICSELAELLEDEGYVIHCAENVREALEKIKSTHYHVIFLDLLMPKVDGLSALRMIKKKVGKTALVMMSAYLSPDVEKEVLKEGAFTCVAKPFQLKEIQQIIDKVIKQGKSRGR